MHRHANNPWVILAAIWIIIAVPALMASCQPLVPLPAAVPMSLQPSDTAKPEISCQFRGRDFCQPTRFDV